MLRATRLQSEQPWPQRHVRLWHLADVQTALMNVRFEGNNGHDADVTAMSANDPKRTFGRGRGVR